MHVRVCVTGCSAYLGRAQVMMALFLLVGSCARATLPSSRCTGEITNPLSNLCDILDHTASFASSPALVYLRHVRVQLLAPLFFWCFGAMRGLFGMHACGVSLAPPNALQRRYCW